MNRFNQRLPKAYSEMIARRGETITQISVLREELGDVDETDYHDCDCEYCPVPEVPDPKPLTKKQRAQKEQEVERLREVELDYDRTIVSVEGYAKLVGVKLPKIGRKS